MIYSFPLLISQKGIWGLGAAILGCVLLAAALKSNQELGLEERFQKACLLVIVRAFQRSRFVIYSKVWGMSTDSVLKCACAGRFHTAGVSYFQYRVPAARSNLYRTSELYVAS